MKKLAIVVGSIVLTLSAGANAQGDVIAQAGGASVTQSDIATLVKSLSPEERQRLAANPAQLDQAVRSQLAVKAVLAEAKSKGWDQQPQVKQMIEQAQRDVVVRSYLASVSAPAADYPSDADLQAAYDANKQAFAMPRALHIAQIYVAVPPNADAATIDKARKQATDLAHQAHAAGADFGAIAKANSQDKTSAVNGGDMGYVPDNMMVPEIRQAADGMKPGDVAGPVQTQAGFHVLKLVDVRPAGTASFDQVKERLRASLKQQRAQQNAQAYMAKLVGPSSVTIDEATLGKALSSVQ